MQIQMCVCLNTQMQIHHMCAHTPEIGAAQHAVMYVCVYVCVMYVCVYVCVYLNVQIARVRVCECVCAFK